MINMIKGRNRIGQDDQIVMKIENNIIYRNSHITPIG